MNASPIALAVEPLRSVALARAEKDANELIARYVAKLEAAGMDIDVAYPRPNGRMSREEYRATLARYNIALSLTTYVKPTLRPGEPNLRKHSPEGVARFVTAAKETADAQYTAFVAKLEAKVGACDAAELSGEHVWGYSTLTVAKGEEVEHWRTQQIVNVSKLGLLFNQWPSRKLKR